MFEFVQRILWTIFFRLFQKKKKKKKKKGHFRLCYDNLPLLNQRLQVCFVISSSICYWLFKCGVLRVTRRVSVCVCEGNRVTSQRSVQPVRNLLNRSLCTANTYEHHHCVRHATLFPFRAWTDKTNLKADARDYGKGCYISEASLWCSANHNALGQL